MSDKITNIEDEIVSSLDNKRFLMNLLKENSYLRRQNKRREQNSNKKRCRKITTKKVSSPGDFDSSSDSSDEDSVNQLSSDGSLDSENLKATDNEPLMKRMRKNDNDKTTEYQSFTSKVHSALKEMYDKINFLSKSTAELDTALELHREMPFFSGQSAYSSSDPVPSYIGNVDYTISNDIKSVNVPAKSVAEVNDLNEILENEDTFKRAVRNNEFTLFLFMQYRNLNYISHVFS